MGGFSPPPPAGLFSVRFVSEILYSSSDCATRLLLSVGDHFATAALDLAEHEVLRTVEAERLQNTRLASRVELVL